MSDWLVLVNPHAGKGRTAFDRTSSALADLGVAADVVEVDGLDALVDVVAGAVAEGRDRFVAVGGDGSVNAVVNELLGHEWDTPPTLGVLPAGTGCDLLRTFGISQKLEDAARHLQGEQTYLIDIGVVSGEWGRRHFVNVGDAGVIGAAAQVAAGISPRLGKLRYVSALFRALPRFKATIVDVDAGKRSFSGEALAVVFANGQFFGGGFNIAPKATMVDGELDVQIISAKKREALRLVPKAMKGLHLTDKAVKAVFGARGAPRDRDSLACRGGWRVHREYSGGRQGSAGASCTQDIAP